jgi:hypothetical protein
MVSCSLFIRLQQKSGNRARGGRKLTVVVQFFIALDATDAQIANAVIVVAGGGAAQILQEL